MGFLLSLVLVEVYRVRVREEGKFIYPIDDVYMHLAVAKNLIHHGTWAVSPYNGFCNCISSMIWPLVIAPCFLLFGQHEYLPIILNLLAACGALAYAGGILRRTVGSGIASALVLGAVVFLTPLAVVVLLGMEHSLQILTSLVFVDLAARLLGGDGRAMMVDDTRSRAALCAAATLVVVSRYEGLFLVAAAGLLLLLRRRWHLAAALALCAGAPVLLSGLLSAAEGSSFLPTSLLLKGNIEFSLTPLGLMEYFSKGCVSLWREKHFLATVVALTLALAASLRRRRTLWSYTPLFLCITFLTTIQHLQFASLGWFYRYEAYLIALTLVGAGITILEGPPRPAGYWRRAPGVAHTVVLAVAAWLLGTPLWNRAAGSLTHLTQASYNIYEQQYQMARFVRRFYNGRGVVANDIGAIDYLADIKLVDTVGLANVEILRARRTHTFDHALLRRLSREHEVELVMVYDRGNEAYGGSLPEWVPIGRWTIPNNTVAYSPTVSFYAADRRFAPRLTQAMREFAAELPKDVVQDGSYVGP